MKTFFTIIFAILCVVVLFMGNNYWQGKTAVSVGTTATEDHSSSKPKVNEKDEGKSKSEVQSTDRLLSSAQNWPESARESFEQSLQDKKTFKIMIIGSEAIGNDGSGWTQLVNNSLLETYGEQNVDVSIHTYDLTTANFIQESKHIELAEESPDLVLLEPFTLNDNGMIEIEDSLEHISTFIEEAKLVNPNVTFVLQPPHPLYQATFYPLQVEALNDYAEANGIAYLDHWTVWPDPETTDLKDYLLADQSAPNDKGHALWGKFINDYLISQ
jgi:hypothetical protein